MIYLYYGVFRSRTIIVFCQFFPFVLSYSMYFGPPRLGTCIFMCYAFLMYCPLYHYQMSILVFCYLFILKSILSDIDTATSTFLWILFAWSIIFHSFTLSLCLFLQLRYIVWRLHVWWVFFFDPTFYSVSFYWSSVYLYSG